MDAARIRRILLIRRRALGDALVTIPAIEEICDTWPDARIDLVIDRPFAALIAELVPRVNVLTYPAPDGSPWVKTLRAGRYDLVIDWLSTPATALWSILTGARFRVGYALRRRWWAYNVQVPRNREGADALRSFAGESFLDPLRRMGLAPAPWRDGIAASRVGADAGPPAGPFAAWLSRWLERPGARIAVVMSATWSAKAWPAEHILELLGTMRSAGWNPVLVTGPGDEALAERLRPDLEDEFWAPPTNLAELAVLLKNADLFVGTDCGVRHLAASLGVATVTIFGPTDAGGWNPALPDHVAVRLGIECSPCDLTHCPVPGHPCMSELKPDMVRKAAARVLARREAGRID